MYSYHFLCIHANHHDNAKNKKLLFLVVNSNIFYYSHLNEFLLTFFSLSSYKNPQLAIQNFSDFSTEINLRKAIIIQIPNNQHQLSQISILAKEGFINSFFKTIILSQFLRVQICNVRYLAYNKLNSKSNKMAQYFCKSYADKIFSKYDKNNNNVLDRGELKYWLRQQLANTPFRKEKVRQSFLNLVSQADTNGDGKIDRWEMYEYCLRTYVPIQ